MARFFPLGITFWMILGWSTNYAVAAIGLTVEEQLQQLRDDYRALAEKDSQLEALEQQNVKKLTIQKEAQKSEIEALKSKVEQQDLMLNALERTRDGRTGWKDTLRQATSRVPRCCCDLQCMGQTINGFYLVMGDKSVETVFCDFSKSPSDPSFQRRIGLAQTKSTPIYFNVQKQINFDTPKVPVPFEKEILNVGGAMNLTSGIFTAPVNGKYFFSFNGLVLFGPSTEMRSFGLVLYRNQNWMGEAKAVSNSNAYDFELLSIQSTLDLIKGDIIFLYTWDKQYEVYLGGSDYTHFTGWLLEEDISQTLQML